MKCEHCGYDDHGTGGAHACTKFNRQVPIVAPLGAVMGAQIQMERDAARYQAIRQRYGMKLSRMIDGDCNFSSDKSRQKIDAWADAAVKEVAEWDALSAEEKRVYFETELARLK